MKRRRIISHEKNGWLEGLFKYFFQTFNLYHSTFSEVLNFRSLYKFDWIFSATLECKKGKILYYSNRKKIYCWILLISFTKLYKLAGLLSIFEVATQSDPRQMRPATHMHNLSLINILWISWQLWTLKRINYKFLLINIFTKTSINLAV